MAVIKRRCDVPMARKKGLLRLCDHKCSTCVACLEMDESGQEEHAVRDLRREMDPKLVLRNIERLSGRTRSHRKRM